MTITCNYVYPKNLFLTVNCFTSSRRKCHKKGQMCLGYQKKFYMCNTVLSGSVYIYTPLNEEPQGSSSALWTPEVDAGSLKHSTNLNCVKLKDMISSYYNCFQPLICTAIGTYRLLVLDSYHKTFLGRSLQTGSKQKKITVVGD